MDFSFNTPRVLRFGCNALQGIGRMANELRGKNAIIITSQGMSDREPHKVIIQALKAANIKVNIFNLVPPDPTIKDLLKCQDFWSLYPCDLVIGFGGGSAMDVAKIIAMLAKNSGSVEDFFGIGKVVNDGLPTIMVPTTAGTGSEVSQDAVLRDLEEGTKKAIKDLHLIPNVAIIDPIATYTMPPELTAITGMDALTHAIEAYVSKKSSVLSDGMALQAMRLISESLYSSVFHDVCNTKAREGMALASLLAGMAFSNAGTAAVHACAYPLSAMFGIPHGKANALMLPYVTEFNMGSTVKFKDIQNIFGKDLPSALAKMVQEVGLPTKLSEEGLSKENIPAMAKIVIQDKRHLSVNPRDITLNDLENIFMKAL